MWKNLRDPEVLAYFGENGIDWRFICERAPWWGGFYESLVRSVKTPLRKILGMSLLEADELETILKEVEAMLNTRPLTYVYSDKAEPEPLTPSHFIIGKRLTLLPPLTKQTTETLTEPPEQLTRRARYRDRLLNSYWEEWRGEYFQQLSNQVSKFPSSQQPVYEGQVVVLHDDNTPRHKWRLGVIEKVIPSRDKIIRSVLLRTQRGVITRAVQHLFPLEITAHTTDSPAAAIDAPTEVPEEELSPSSSEREDEVAEPQVPATGEDVGTRTTRSGRQTRRPAHLEDFEL